MSKEIFVAFVSEKLKTEFQSLESGKFEDQQLYSSINQAIEDIKANPQCGIRVPKKLWPKEYIQKFGVTNLWKYDFSKAWRLIYTIKSNEIQIVSIILEWFNHKGYEKRFKY